MFAVAPLVGIYPVFLMKALCFALFACAFNLLIGYAGLLSFGHAVFLGTAGYVCGARGQGVGLAARARHPRRHAVAAALGVRRGPLAIRRQGIYFAMITLALAQMIYFFYLQAPFTDGEDGIQAVPRGRLFGLFDLRRRSRCTISCCRDLPARLPAHPSHDPLAVRPGAESDPRKRDARDLARLRADHYKLLAFVLSAALAGLAGATKALVFQLASLTDVHWTMSGEVVLMTLLGGIGTMFGPVVGAFVIIGLRTISPARSVGDRDQGVIFVVCVLAFRRGIVGELSAWWDRRRA